MSSKDKGENVGSIRKQLILRLGCVETRMSTRVLVILTGFHGRISENVFENRNVVTL